MTRREVLYIDDPVRPPIWANVEIGRPKVINFQVNDVCNAKCVMCHIWKQEFVGQISPEEFRAMLADEFFCEIEQVGITGGERTLRPDLADFYAIAAEVLPRLKGGHFITNGYSTERAVEVYGAIAKSYNDADRYFGGMVSIDGVAAVHDRVRGRPGSFERATRTLFALRDAGVQVAACCTIVKENVYDLRNLLEWGMKNNVYVRFRLAEFIKRLYNSSATDQIRAFDSHELKHLVSFFHSLLLWYEPSEEVRRTYTSLLSILTGGHRLVACPYQSTESLVIDAMGRLAQCSPQGSPTPAGASARAAMTGQLRERVSILQTKCASCVHDYHSDWLPAVAEVAGDVQTSEVATAPSPSSERPFVPFNPAAHRTLCVVGWYGTETAGDIAILGGLLKSYLDVNPSLRFNLFSLYPYYTRVTLRDLQPAVAERITLKTYGKSAVADAATRDDAVVMAGGPLMDIAETGLIAEMFEAFRGAGKQAVLAGVGVGPLNVAAYRANVERAARSASAISTRDHGSRFMLRGLGIGKRIDVVDDPAVRFVEETGIKWRPGRSRVVRCFVRELTGEYRQRSTPADAAGFVETLLRQTLAADPDVMIELLPMHYFPVGFDDRVFAEALAAKIDNPRLTAVVKPLSPVEILSAMATAQHCIAMRFHSVVFARTIGAPFTAIDYTHGGKIDAFLREHGLDRHLYSFDSPVADVLAHVNAPRLAAGVEAR